MAKTPRPKKRFKAIVRVNKTLETSVIEVLSDLMPEARVLPHNKALQMILDDLGLLARCFVTYREHPERFRHLLIAPEKHHVKTSNELLVCGRSFDEVIGMIVRTAAKRHFLQEIDGNKRPFRAGRFLTPEEMSVVQKVFSIFGRKYTRSSDPTKAMKLYEALAENISFDWQVALVPEYATLPVPLVEKMGPQILDYKVPEEIRKLRQDPDNPPPPSKLVPRPLFVPPPAEPEQTEWAPEEDDSTAAALTATVRVEDRVVMTEVPTESAEPTDRRAKLEEILSGDGKRLMGKAFNTMLLDPKIRTILPDTGHQVRVGDTLNLVSGSVVKMFVNVLGLRQDQLAVMLIWAHHSFGEETFISMFGSSGKLDAINRIIARMQAQGITQNTSLEDVADLAKRGFAPTPEAKT